MPTFKASELKTRTPKLLRDLREGRVSLLTSRGRIVGVVVPLDLALSREDLRPLVFELLQAGAMDIERASRVIDTDAGELVRQLDAKGYRSPIDEAYIRKEIKAVKQITAAGTSSPTRRRSSASRRAVTLRSSGRSTRR